MSYDLFLYPKSGTLDLTAVSDYFKCRKNYSLEANQAFYENEATGVYFSFDIVPDAGERPLDDEVPEPDGPCIAFNLNYSRPSYFGLEADIELKAISDALGLLTWDPQCDNGEPQLSSYDRALFLKQWNEGNRYGVRVLLEHGQQNEQKLGSMSSARLNAMWEWNYYSNARQDSLEVDVFVPKLFVIQHEGRAVTVCVWPDGIPIEVLRPDYFMMQRQKLARRSLFGRKNAMFLVPFEEAYSVLRQYDTTPNTPIITMRYLTPPQAVVDFVRNYNGFQPNPQATRLDMVVDEELFV